MRRHGVILFPSKEQDVIKLMLEKVVADSTMYFNKYGERTYLSACSVPPKCYSSTSKEKLQYQLYGTGSGTEGSFFKTSEYVFFISTSGDMIGKSVGVQNYFILLLYAKTSKLVHMRMHVHASFQE